MDNIGYLLSHIRQADLQQLVTDADQAALANVRAAKGGPFGALLCLGNLKTGRLQRIGAPACNAVLSTGLPGAHAEDQVLDKSHIDELKHRLCNQGAADSFVVLASSAESCPSCHSKVEIFCRQLITDNLLLPGRFILAYGASYTDTFQIAGFNDKPYLLDLSAPQNQRMVTITTSHAEDLPAPVAKRLSGGKAVIQLADGQLFTGMDERGHHFTLTPEVSAIYAACTAQKQSGVQEAWNLGGATLFSHVRAPGPLAYTTCQWANVTKWVICPDDEATFEAPDIDNATLFNLIATRPYNGAGTCVHIIQTPDFANTAQKFWQQNLAQENTVLVNYNGIEEKPA